MIYNYPEEKCLELTCKRGNIGRPFKDINGLFNKLCKDNPHVKIEMVNDFLYRVKNKYFFLTESLEVSLIYKRLNLVECTTYNKYIIGHVLRYRYYDRRYGILEVYKDDMYEISFVFDNNGELVDHKTMSKLAMLGVAKKYKCFRHDL